MVTRLDLGGTVHATARLTGYRVAWLESGVVPWVLVMGDTWSLVRLRDSWMHIGVRNWQALHLHILFLISIYCTDVLIGWNFEQRKFHINEDKMLYECVWTRLHVCAWVLVCCAFGQSCNRLPWSVAAHLQSHSAEGGWIHLQLCTPLNPTAHAHTHCFHNINYIYTVQC